MADTKSLSDSRIAFSLTLEKDDIAKAQKKVLDRHRAKVNLSGFRKGKAPDEAVIGAVGINQISAEALNEALNQKYHDFVTTNKIMPVSPPKVDMDPGKELPLEVKLEVEVFPEVKLGDYKKIKIDPMKVEISEQEIDDVIETIMSDMKLGKPVDRPAKKKDAVEVDFAGKDKEGNVVPGTKAEKHALRLGFQNFLPDLEKGIEGMKPGEEKTIKVKFPKDYRATELAGKTLPFEVKLHNVTEVSAQNLEEAMVEKMVGQKKSVSDFRNDVKELITRNKTDAEKKKKREEFYKKLDKVLKAELPKSWIEKEVEGRLQHIKNAPQYQHDPEAFWKQVGKTEEALKKEFQSTAERDLRIMLGMGEVLKQENIELDADEIKKAQLLAAQRTGEKAPQEERERALQQIAHELKIDKYLSTVIL